jgi:integrase
MSTRSPRRGIGSVEKLPSGRYRVRFTDPQGRRVSGGTFTTRQLADLELSRITFAIESGTYAKQAATKIEDLDSKTATLRELAEHWRETRLRQGQTLAATTLQEYERLVNNVLTPFADMPVRSITAGQVDKWWKPEHKRAPNQASKAYKHLKTLMGYALKRRWITESPCVIDGATSYRPVSRPEIPTREQVEIMVRESPEPFNVVVSLAAWGGFRKGEIFALRRKDVVFEKVEGETWVSVRVERAVTWIDRAALEKTPKTEGSIRTVELPPELVPVLKGHLNSVAAYPDALLFERRPASGEHWLEFQLNPLWRAARAAAGFSGTFHSLRAFAGTTFAQTGATTFETMDRLGHRNIKTAMAYQRATGRDRELVKGLMNG